MSVRVGGGAERVRTLKESTFGGEDVDLFRSRQLLLHTLGTAQPDALLGRILIDCAMGEGTRQRMRVARSPFEPGLGVPAEHDSLPHYSMKCERGEESGGRSGTPSRVSSPGR